MSEYHPEPGPPPGQYPYQQGSNTLAVASLVLGILSYACALSLLAAIPGIVCGHMALGQVRRGEAPEDSRGLAIAGLVLSYVNLFFFVLLALFFFFMGASVYLQEI